MSNERLTRLQVLLNPNRLSELEEGDNNIGSRERKISPRTEAINAFDPFARTTVTTRSPSRENSTHQSELFENFYETEEQNFIFNESQPHYQKHRALHQIHIRTHRSHHHKQNHTTCKQ